MICYVHRYICCNQPCARQIWSTPLPVTANETSDLHVVRATVPSIDEFPISNELCLLYIVTIFGHWTLFHKSLSFQSTEFD